MKYHMLAFAIGTLLDLIIGDPHCMPHPIRLIGGLISFFEKKLNREDKKRALRNGRITAVLVCAIVFCTAAFVSAGAYMINIPAGIIAESVLTYYLLAARSLRDESMKVYRELKKGDLIGSRKAVSMIVGRDTDVLDMTQVTKAAVETVAENTSDGVIAPMLFTALGGPALGFLYKAVNTMDSMIGYKNDRYINFGRAAAKTDDLLNYLPSRLSAFFMLAACALLGRGYDMRRAYRIYKRDCRKHASPNSAQTESACAGALGIRLAGDARYFGIIHKKPFIGDPVREIEYEDIKRACRLMFMTELICFVFCIAAMTAVRLFFDLI